MSAEKKKKSAAKTKETTFNCKFCQQEKPLAEMAVLSRFFPPMVACQECEKKLR